ncbi:MAG TPA: hypothetical protein VGR78_04890 [Verrucomicrobiae bacterium]|nr:hypothetical protein [Verrucomicrobiae bacterium]
MKIKNTFLFASRAANLLPKLVSVSTTLFALLVSLAAQAETISVNFVGGGFFNGAPAPLSPTESAGVNPATHWNNLADNSALSSPGPGSGSAKNLLDDSGAATTAGISWVSDNTWSTPSIATDPNSRMMRGYLDNGSGDAITLTVSGLTYPAYDVYVYFSDDNTDPVNGTTGAYTLGSRTIYGRDPGAYYSGAFVQASGTSATDSNANGNYLVFSGVTGPSFTLTAALISFRAPVNALQIVNAPPQPPQITITPSVTISWPSNSGDFVLQASSSLGSDAIWSPVDVPLVVRGTNITATVEGTLRNRFFRLTRDSIIGI